MLKLIGMVVGLLFTACVFIQGLLTLSPRMTSLESRVAMNENKISAIEFKLDTLIKQGEETQKDVKDIYKLLIK